MMVAEPVVTAMKARITERVAAVREKLRRSPKLVALLIGDDPISRTYVDLKRKDCAEVGIESEVLDLSGLDASEISEKVVQTLRQLNDDKGVDAVIPQMPFSGKVSEELVFSILSPEKDVDGLTPYRLGKLLRGEYELERSLLPCTPKGVVLLLKHYGVNTSGADVGIVGRSTLVGEPLRKLLQDRGATATCYHTRTKDLFEKIKGCDIIVAASGRPPEMYGKQGFRLLGEMVKEGSAVVSVGVRKDEKSGKMLFDVDTKSMKGVCSFLTPNVGGVGAMTRAALLQNTVNAVII
jgi:methylenetetrahydrofolate dehydrogenase (NADP+) / methenyltetrahydrofolate cyclohydrolase